MDDITTIHGDSGGEILLSHAKDGDEPKTAPMLVGAESGYACFQSAIENVPDSERLPLLGLADSMRASDEGMWLATVDGSKRRLGIVQSNRGLAEGAGFYESHHGADYRDRPIWRDYYYRAAFFLLDQIDREWTPDEVVIHHLTGYGWPPDLAPVVLEAVGNLLDSRPVGIERLIFTNGTCGLKDPDEMKRAVEVLSTDEQLGHHEIKAEEHPPSDLGYDGAAPVRLWKVEVLRDGA